MTMRRSHVGAIVILILLASAASGVVIGQFFGGSDGGTKRESVSQPGIATPATPVDMPPFFRLESG